MKKIIFFAAIILIGLTACDKGTFRTFEGTYDLVTNGDLNMNVAGVIDTVIEFKDEPGITIIKKGDADDELFIYIETGTVTDVIPMGMYVTAKIDGDKYDIDAKVVSITLIQGISLSFTIDGSGTLSEKNEILTSKIKFTGLLKGTLDIVGKKR